MLADKKIKLGWNPTLFTMRVGGRFLFFGDTILTNYRVFGIDVGKL